MKFKQVKGSLNESLIKEETYQEFILGMMGELVGGNFFTAGICPDDWFEDMPYEERAFSSFIDAKEWCEKTLRKFEKGALLISLSQKLTTFTLMLCLRLMEKIGIFTTEDNRILL